MDKEAHQLANRKYYEKHKARLCAKARKYYLANRAACIARAMKYYHAHRNEINALLRALRSHNV